ncbi:hypothetical protein GCM10029963_30240 [Micromonospora andamanensis]
MCVKWWISYRSPWCVMSHLDPYGGAEARDWDRPDRPTSLPWPDPDVEPGPWGRGRYVGDRPAQEGRNGHPPAGWDQPPNGRNGARDLEHGDAPTAQIAPVRVGDGRDHDDAPTTQMTPVRVGPGLEHGDAPTTQLAAVPPGDADPEAAPADATDAPGRRHRGRRRAGAGRPATQQSASRAGRNLPAAISVGVGLGAVVLLPLFLYTPAFLLVLVAAFGVGIWEMSRAVRRGGAEVPLVPSSPAECSPSPLPGSPGWTRSCSVSWSPSRAPWSGGSATVRPTSGAT